MIDCPRLLLAAARASPYPCSTAHWRISAGVPTTSLSFRSIRRRRPSALVQSASSGSGSQSSVAESSEAAEWAMQELAVTRVHEVRQSAGLDQLEEEITSLKKKSVDSSLWDDPSKAQEILVTLTEVKDRVKLLNDFNSQVEETETIVKLTEQLHSIDTGLLEEASKIIKPLNKALDNFEMTQLLSGPYDKESAVINITAGASGTDAQTSFAGVEVMPLLPEESMDVGIPEDDLEISFTREGGKGGQNVNKVETVHIPTGIAIRCTEERSQLSNKIKALSRLKVKLLVIAEEQRTSEIKQIRGDVVKAEWGQQIRNYIFHPYNLVKDVPTSYETSDITSVMDDELDTFIRAYLKYKLSAAAEEQSVK